MKYVNFYLTLQSTTFAITSQNFISTLEALEDMIFQKQNTTDNRIQYLFHVII